MLENHSILGPPTKLQTQGWKELWQGDRTLGARSPGDMPSPTWVLLKWVGWTRRSLWPQLLFDDSATASKGLSYFELNTAPWGFSSQALAQPGGCASHRFLFLAVLQRWKHGNFRPWFCSSPGVPVIPQEVLFYSHPVPGMVMWTGSFSLPWVGANQVATLSSTE